MRKEDLTQDWKKKLLLAVAVPVAIYLLWTTTHFVIAYQEIKHAHILPKSVDGTGWNSPENALTQDLPSQAPIGSFTKNNSAYIELPASTSTEEAPVQEMHLPESQPIQMPQPVTPSSTPTSTPATPPAPPAEAATTSLPLPVIVSPEAPLLRQATSTQQTSTTSELLSPPVREASTTPKSASSTIENLPPPNIVQILEAAMPVASSSSSSATSTAATSTSSMIGKILPIASRSFRSAGEFLLSQLVETAFATTTGVSTPSVSSATTSSAASTSPEDVEVESTSTPITVTGEATSTPPSVPDVSSCSTLGTACHTMDFGGFGVSGSLTEKEFHGAILKFSFANMSAESPKEDSKLEVRYFHAGKWQTAGEVFLNKELSNFTNGGYFSAKLNGIDSWSDLSDLHVVIEYVRGDDHIESKVYLDSLWIDTSFKDRVQDVLSGNTDAVNDAPDNVTFDLPQGSASFNTLITEDGTHISFPYVDTLTDDSLAVRMDRQQYKVPKDASPSTVYASITNTTQSAAKFKTYTSFPGGKGTVVKAMRYMRDVPVSTSTPIYHDVTYYCGDGWRSASSTGDYSCVSTQELYRCDAVADSGVNCLVKNVHVADATSTSYVSAWVDAPESHVVDQDKDVAAVLPPGYMIAASSDQDFDILPGQTIYLQLQINTPDSTSRKFVLSVKGDGVFGDADSLRLKDEAAWQAQRKFAKAQPERSHVNDQISGKNDFAVDELPSFRFKFKTQRSFFQRVLDFLSRNNISYRVDKAVLIRNDGEEEHVPVSIGYDQNGEWELQLEKPPRSFRPGKYTVELMMDEAGQTYTDAVNFYWGVLAVNSNKSVYGMGENAHLMMAALDDGGNTLCDAQLDLSITDPSGATENIPVISGGGCGFNNVTDLPDYVADYSPSISGEYTINLARLDDKGEIINSTADSFSVEADPAISIEREGPTRIYPVSTYKMRLNVAARDAFAGTVTEILPEGFTVPVLGGGTLVRKNGALYLSWNVNLAAGASAALTYTFKAPEASPYLYILGPATLTEEPSKNQIFQERRTWKIASDALSIASGVAWLSGTTTGNNVEFNNAAASAINWTTDDYDTTYFTHSTTTSNTRLTINVAGDYLVSVTVPTTRTDGANTVSGLETDIRVNGIKVNQGVSRSTNNRSSQRDATMHLAILLHNLNAGDYVEAYTRAISTVGTLTVRSSNQATLYAEYIQSSATVFSAVATTTTLGTNLNNAATSSMVWYDVGSRVDSGYSHVNGPSATAANITLNASGDYMVSINIPNDNTAAPVANMRARARVLLNGVMASSSAFEQDYIPNSNAETAASMHLFGILHATTSNTTLSVAVQQDEKSAAGTATVDADQASIYIQKLPSSDVYIARATTTDTGTDFNASATATSTVLWQLDDVIDAADYTHSTAANSGTITFAKAGDYLLAYNDALTGFTARAAPKVSVVLTASGNGSASGAQINTHLVRNAAGVDSDSSGALLYFLRNINSGDTLSIGTIADTVVGAMTPLQNAYLMLWRKAAQSNWIQDTEAWYQNPSVASTTPTTRWTGTLEGDAITAGNAVLSGNALRLRMALQAQTNTTAGADNFKLQYAAGSTCTPALAWIDVGASGSGSIWRAHPNTGLTPGSTLPSTLLSVSSTTETYEESNPSAATPNGVSSGKDGEWDWSIEDNGAAVGTSYCFRMVQSNGTALKNYNDYPQLITNNSPRIPTLATPFDNEKLASTSPWFTFKATDDNGDSVNYEVQISTVSTFSSTVVDTDSNTNTNDFDNVQTPSNRQPFNSGETIRYKTASTLSNGTTYYWRVRAIDPNGTNAYGSWSATQSFTVDTSVTVSTWFQTQTAQFNQGTLYNVESTSTHDVGMSAGQTSGTIASPAILYSSHTTGNSWGTFSWNNTYTPPNSISYQVEYLDATSTWTLVPDSDLPGNSAGTTTSSGISLSSLDPSTYGTLRLRANFSQTSATPRLLDWTLSWALSVARPTLIALFDNEKTPTTTPTFKFTSVSPQGNKLTYQMQWSTDATFATSVSSSTSDSATTTYGWSDVTTPGSSSPFVSGHTVQFTISTTTTLVNGTTYWWRVRAKDPFGNNAYSLWSTPHSFTVDTTVDRSTWFQTTTEQFNTDSLSRVTAVSGTVSGVTDVGKIAIYRAAVAGEAITAATIFNHTFDTTVRQDTIYSTQYANSSILLKAGYYAIMYGFRADSTAGASQSTMQSDLSLASTTLPIGWSTGFMRRSTGATQAFSSGGGIIKAATDNTSLVLQTFRTDTLTSNTQSRTGNTPGIQLVRLDSTWPYLRLSKTGTQVGPTNSNWVVVRYDRLDDVNTDYYSYTQGGGSIVIYKTGHYLVFANTYGAVTTGANNVINQKLVLNGSDVRGTYSSIYMTSTNGNLEGAPSIGTIVNVTSPTSTLSVQLNHSVGTNPWTIDADSSGAYVDRSAITIVKVPEGDFIRLGMTTAPIMNPAALTPISWDVEDEKNIASFTHSNVTNASQIQANVSGDYLAFTSLYASTTLQTLNEFEQGWQKNGAGGFIQYSTAGGYQNSATAGYTSGSWSGTIFPGLVNGDYFESVWQGVSTNLNGLRAADRELEAVRIASLTENDTTPQTVQSSDIVFSSGNGPRWDAITWNDSKPGTTNIKYSIYYYNSASSSYQLVPNSALTPKNPQLTNSVGTSSGPIDISGLDRVTYGTLRLFAALTCAAGQCPTLNDWTVTWNPGITVSGIAKQFDETTNMTSGTVAVAVNGTIQTGKTATISGSGTWTLNGINAGVGDVITVWIAGASFPNKAVAITKPTQTGNVTNMALYQGHLTLGSDDNPTITNADIGQYDNSVSGNSDIFDEDDASNNLYVCAIGLSGCFNSKLLVKAGTVYRPSSGTSVSVNTRHFENDGTLIADGNTLNISGSWKNTYVFTKNSSTVVFTATSTSEVVDSTGATSSAAFNNVTFGSGSGAAIWKLYTPLAASGTLAINFGTVAPNSTSTISLSGDLTIGASGIFAKNATTTFMGTVTETWTDSSAGQDLGVVFIGGASTTVQLGSNVKASDLTINPGNMLDASAGNYNANILGNWNNNSLFNARQGTVTFLATTTGKTITPGISSFYNLTFNGTNGNWSFTTPTTTAMNNFTVTAGTVTLPTGTTTVGGNWDTFSGVFQHNNSTVLFNATASGKTIHVATSTAFYDMAFNGSGGGWSFIDQNATSSRTVLIQAGTLTTPSGVFTIGGTLTNSGGGITANSGTLKLTGASANSVTLGGSSAFNLTFSGIGPFTMNDVNATSTGSVRFEQGTTTLPSGTFTVGGSFVNPASPSGGFLSNSGTVKFNAAASGNSITTGLSNFYNLLFNGALGSWTITGNATSTNNTSFTQANSITQASGTTLEVDGIFTNSLADASTTWAGAALYLNSGTSYAINTKSNGGDTYAQLTLGANTQVSAWNSSASAVAAASTGSFYSENHAGVSGALNIYGAFSTSSPVSWAYQMDFDNTTLATGRKVNVRIASSSFVTLSGSSTIQGIATASTTITSQGAGFFTFNILGGTTTAKYYSVGSTTPNGLQIFGRNTVISSLDNGEFELGSSGGTSISVGSEVLDKNPQMQIMYTKFSTSTGVVNGFNVTATTTPLSSVNYWWFKNGYGPLYGESHNNDIGGSPGYIRFDDSGISVTISGTVYSDHGSTPMGNSVCQTGTTSAKVFIHTSAGLTYSGTCDSSGAYSITATFFTNSVITVYLKTNGGPRAAAITKNVTGNLSGMDLYQNAVIIRQFDVSPTAIADMIYTDSTFNSDIPFTATSSLMVQPETELYIWPGKSFSPGGNVTLQSGGSGDARDGRLYLATSSTFTLTGTQSLAIGGGLQLDSGATFNAGNSMLIFTATTTGKNIYSTKPLALYDVAFAGTGGGWNFFGTSTATTSMHTLTLTAGTVGGSGDMDVQTGNLTGAGTINMTGGTFLFEPTGNFGNTNAWTFTNLLFGTGAGASTTSKTGTGTTTVTGVLTVASNQTLLAGTSPLAAWVLSGGGTPFVINGTFNAQLAPFWYTSNSATNIAGTSYGPLVLAPSGAGSPTYTLTTTPTGTLVTGTTTIGDGTHAVTVTADTNDPTVDFTKDLTINAGATFIASNIIDTNIEGSWLNAGTFTPSGRMVIFDATSTGRTINPGSSPFAKLQFNSSSGGWTITANATSTSDMTLSAAQSFALASGKSFEVDGTFSNSAASSSQTWTGSLLYLNSGTNYTINAKSSGNAMYGTVSLGANTNIRDWNSAQSAVILAPTASLYAMNYASSSGALNIWGAYTRSSGSDYWDYATDFDGTSLGGTSRKVNVSIASSSVLTFSGGLLDIIGAASASTTIQNQGSGAYAWNVSGGTINAQYFEVRNTDFNGLNLSGYPVISGLGNGDFLLTANGGSMITVNGTVIVSNPLKVFRYDKFATSTGITAGFNVTPVAATSSFWKFTLHYGNYAGEAYDNDPDPGFIHWDDSNDKITISGTVYTDDGATKEGSRLCDGTTPVLKLKVAGLGSASSSCAVANGAFTFNTVAYNPGDVLTLYIASSSLRSATVTRGETANINNMDIYEHRVIVRHEDTIPIAISDLHVFDSGQDAMVPFLTTLAATNTLIVEPNTKFVVWTGKTFSPAGNVTVSSGGVNSWDGTLELQTNATFRASGSQSHSFGGSFLLGTGSTYMAANSTVIFTATTTGKTITPQSSAFYNVTFNGAGGNWAFSSAATSSNDFTISNGTVTLPTSVLEVGGSFNNTGGAFQHNNGTLKLTSTTAGKTIQVNNSPLYNLVANGTGGSWNFTDSSATSSNDLTISAGTLKAPSNTFTIGGSFLNSGIFNANNGTVKMISAVGGKTIQVGGSDFYNLLFSGVGGGWTFSTLNATTARDFVISTGTVTMASGTLAVGGNFNTVSSTFLNNSGIVKFTATTTGFNINVGTSTFYQLVFDSSAGGWTIGSNATSTATTTITNAASFTLSSGRSLEVDGVFNNLAGSATAWSGSTLYLNSGGAYSINSRTNTGATYGQLTLGTNTQVRDWNSTAAITTPGASAYLYSQNDGNVNGMLLIYGAYTRTSGTDYWNANTDFDGTDISGSPRQANVRIATSSSVLFSGGSLSVIGTPTATTTIYASGTTGYAFSLAGGSTTMQYYQFKNMDQNGVVFSGSPLVNTLSNGDFELSAASGTAITLGGTVIDANANLTISTIRFASTTANIKGFNVMLSGTPVNFWTFTLAYGNIAGESFNADGPNACGHIRWDDSICLQMSQSHYRFRNDDGGEGADPSTWYNASWTRRIKIAISNPNAIAYTNLPVKIQLPYKSSMLANFDDLRFTDSTGTSSIPFWRESTINSGTTTVWVKIASLPASGSAVVYAYYGNSGAAAGDDSANTFPYIDTFDSGSIAVYSGADSSLFSTNASFNYGNGSFGLSASAGNTTGKTVNGGIYKTSALTGTGNTVRYFQYVASGGQDEPCTLFGVQAAKQNYGVCLEQFPTTNRRVSLSKNIAYNDNGDTATVLASTSVAYTTSGWYEVIIDWLTGGTINVKVNDPNGNAFASLSKTDSTYSSGGAGFAFFFQSQGWDDYMVKPYTATTPTYLFGAEQQNNGATWKAAEDTKANITAKRNTRLRFNVQNTGSSFNYTFRLQYAPKGAFANCEAVPTVNYNDVPVFNSCGLSDICMASSTLLTNLASTSPSLTYPASFGYAQGNVVQDPSNQSLSYYVPKNYATELEYTFNVTSHATLPAYCFRVWNAQGSGADLDSYNHVAEGDVMYPPFITNFQLNNSQNIVLTEGTTTTVYASSTVTDYNGYADILSATSSIYLSTLPANCASDPINCYQIATSSCSLSNCAGNSCSMMCRADIQYFAEPTDASSTNYATTTTNWLATMAVTDSTGLKDTQTSIGQELLTLYGLRVNVGNIAFATTTANSDTGRTVSTTTVRNTGNAPISVNVLGTDLTNGGNTIPVGQQKVASSTFQYATCSLCTVLQGASAQNMNVNIPRPTSTTTAQTSDLYWGIGIPNGTSAGTYSGTNTFIAVGAGP